MGVKVGVVVVNYASHQLIEQNLGGVAVGDDLLVIIVDNFSSDAERATVTALAQRKGWVFLPNPNTGFGGGANTGATAALAHGCDAVVIVNPDLEIDTARIGRLAAEAVARPLAIVAPLVVDASGQPWGRLGYVDVEHGRAWSRGGSAQELPWVSGACLAVGADTWTRLGGFSPDYFMYWEDVDLSVRCRRAGGEVILLDEVSATHAVGGTQGEGRSKLYYFYNCRNRLVFAAKHLTPRQRWRWLLLTPAAVRRVARRDNTLTRWQRVGWALPSCLRGAAAGAWQALASLVPATQR